MMAEKKVEELGRGNPQPIGETGHRLTVCNGRQPVRHMFKPAGQLPRHPPRDPSRRGVRRAHEFASRIRPCGFRRAPRLGALAPAYTRGAYRQRCTLPQENP
jgi:hypothetical protein